MRTVTRFEADLLQILHGLLGRYPQAQLAHLVARPHSPPSCLTRSAVELVEQTLAKGCVRWLAVEGWRRERFLRGEQIVEGRLWERTPVEQMGMKFSANSLHFLRWLTASDLQKPHAKWQPLGKQPLTTGDEWLLFLAYQSLRGTELNADWKTDPPWTDHGLCRLFFPEDFTAVGERHPPRFEPWLTMPGLAVIEALQGKLARRIVDIERSKRQIGSPERMRSLGAEQTRTWSVFLEAIDRLGRRELARCFLDASRRQFRGDSTIEAWIGGLNVSGLRLADRVATYHAALALPRLLNRLSDWQTEAKNIGYFDDGYAAAQLWKADWERYDGDRVCRSARELLRHAEPLAG